MSEKIKIIIVIDNGKLNNKDDDLKAQSTIVTHDPSMTIMSTLLKNDLISGSFCGGRGDCGRCRIRFLNGAAAPTALERSAIGAEELRQGYRLACLAKPKEDCTIELAFRDMPGMAVVTDMMSVTEKNDYISQQNLHTKKSTPNVIDISNRPEAQGRIDIKKTDVMIAVDLGTTTIAMQLMELIGGKVLDTYCEMNPQRRYGADVLSRIQASCNGEGKVLQKLVIEVLERGVARFARHTANIKCMCIAGNTAMEHLFMGYDVSSLGRSPFTPVEIGLQEYRHPSWDFKVWLVPGISAFVGGDIVAGLYACGILPGELREELTGQHRGRLSAVRRVEDTATIDSVLFIDLGTNGEMAITDGTHMIVTATAAGPAFEGGSNADIIGSDMVACTASILRQGMMDETGLLQEPYFAEGISIQRAEQGHYRFIPGMNGQSLHLTQEDIRALQMAKAAVRAGVEILLKRSGEGCEDCGKQQPDAQRGVQVYLAGGFGYYLDVEAAFYIGLLPGHMRGRVRAVGNTSLSGAYLIGRDLWQHRIDRQILEQNLSSIESINLANQEEFERLYIQYMNFDQ